MSPPQNRFTFLQSRCQGAFACELFRGWGAALRFGKGSGSGVQGVGLGLRFEAAAKYTIEGSDLQGCLAHKKVPPP